MCFTQIKMYKFNKPKGFTLVELLVVIGVLGVLVAGILIAINPLSMLARGRDSQRKTDMRNIQEALEQYLIDNGNYPIGGWLYSNSASNPWIPGMDKYMKVLPRDPKNDIAGPWVDNRYTYAYWSANGKYYNLVAQLEDKSSPDRCEIEKWVFIVNFNTGGGQPWCPPGYNYSKYIYSRNSTGNN